MIYADTKCTYTEIYKPEHYYLFTGPDILTGKSITVRVKSEELYAYRQGQYIQNALKSNTTEEREFLISGFSKESWDKLWSEPGENCD